MEWLRRDSVILRLLSLDMAMICMVAGVYCAMCTPYLGASHAKEMDYGHSANHAKFSHTQLNYWLLLSTQAKQSKPSHAYPALFSFLLERSPRNALQGIKRPSGHLGSLINQRVYPILSVVPLGFFLRV